MPDDETQVEQPVQATETEAVAETAAETTEAEIQAEPNQLTEAAAEKEPPKPAKNPIKPFQARIDELTREKHEERRKREALEAKLAELEKRGSTEEVQQQNQPAGTVPAEMVDQLAETRAAQIAAQRQFDNDCNLAFVKGKAAHPDFEEALSTFSSLGGLKRDVVEDALGTDAPEQVLYELGKDADEAMRILSLPRNKRIAEFTKITLKAAPKPNVSKAPAPIKTVGGNAKKEFDYADDAADDAEWQARRNAERRAAGKI